MEKLLRKNYKNKISKKKKKKQSIFWNVSVLSESTKFVKLHFELKNKYYSKVVKNILDPSTSPKTYCDIWKTFLSNKEIPVIPTIFHKNKFILKKKLKSKSFKQKAYIFNSHFSKQCTLIYNNSKIPSECPWESNESLSSTACEINGIE